jgi:hypothetical protein
MIAFLLTVSPSLNAQIKRAPKYVVTYNSFGSLKVGMTVSKASKALGVRLVREEQEDCYYISPKSGFKNVSFMVNNRTIARIDVFGRGYATDRGAKVGDTEAKIKRLYKGMYKVGPHKYVDGHYIEVEMKSGNYSIIFETDGKRVTSFRTARLLEVGYVEGCS